MNKTYLLVASIAIATSFYTMPISAQQVDNKCRNAINEGYTRITNTGATFTVVNIVETEFNHSNPYSGNHQLNMFFTGQKAGDVMESPKLLGNISNKIIQSCPSIVNISYGVSPGDYIRNWFRVNDNKALKGKCVGVTRDNSKLLWGYEVCL